MPSIASRTGITTHTADGTVAPAPPSAGSGTGAPAATHTAVPVITMSRGSLASSEMMPGFAQSAFAQQTNMGYPRSFLRPIISVSPIAQRVKLKTIQQTTQVTQADPGQPFPLLGVSASSEPFKTATGEIKCLVSISYTSSPPTGARIWFVGYHGSTTPALVSEGTESPVTFLADPTGETVTVYGESVQNGIIGKGPLTTWAPKTTVVLSPATAAPPAPSMAQNLVGTPTGYQFEFNQIAGLAANVIDGYAIYRNTTDSQTSATQIAYLKQNPKAAAPILFTDVAAQGQSYYYFIASVDTSGNESALTNAQTGAIIPLSTFTATGQLWGPSGISGTSAAAMSLAQVHDVTAVSQGSILLQNANFQAGSAGWTPQSGWAIIAGAGYNGSGYFAQYTGLSTGAIVNNQQIPCSAGAVISAASYVEGSSNATGNACVRVNYFNSAGTSLVSNNGNYATANVGWNQSRCVATAPSGTAYAVIDFAVYSETAGFWNVGGFTASILANSLDEVPDGTTFQRVKGVVAGQTNTESYAANSISASVLETVTGYTYITSSATVSTVSNMAINGGYVTLTACGAVASTNTSALGFEVAFYRNGTLLQPQFAYQVFPTPGNSAYIPFSFSILDSSPGAGPNTYTVVMTTNSGGTMTLIPINFIAINAKA